MSVALASVYLTLETCVSVEEMGFGRAGSQSLTVGLRLQVLAALRALRLRPHAGATTLRQWWAAREVVASG